jgi:flagellar basal-body rod protein FlgB
MAQDVNLLTALKGRMQWHQTRQKLLAENVANADTPRYRPHDLKPFAESLTGQAAPTLLRTRANHLPEIEDKGGQFGNQDGRRFETAPSGNAVNLEDEMLKVADNQMEFQTAVTLYQRSLGYLRTALGRR